MDNVILIMIIYK